MAALKKVKSYTKKKRSSKNKNNSSNLQTPNRTLSKNNTQRTLSCPKHKCECWIRLKKYCEYFKIDYSKIKISEDWKVDVIVEKMTNLKRSSNSKNLEFDMTELWQHYLLHHLGQHNYAQCKLHSLCLFVKGQSANTDYYYYRKQSWNLLQTMHVYFYHTDDYMQSRNSSARKHRYVGQKTSYRMRQTVPTIQTPIRLRHSFKFAVPGSINIDIGQSTASNINMHENMTKVHVELGPGFAHKSSNSNQSRHSYMTATTNNSNRNSDNLSELAMDDEGVHDADSDDDDLDVAAVNQATSLVPIDYYAIQYQSTTADTPLRVLQFGVPFSIIQSDAKYKNPKAEILNNVYCKIAKKEWNDLLKSCIGYSKKRKAREIGLSLKEIVGLKLYTDFDELQRAYRKCYRENQPDRPARQKQFYHWNELLLIACSKSKDIITCTLYHGVNEAFSTPSYSGTYWGPISTTTIFDIAKQFAGTKGRIFELYPTFGRRGLRVSWISNFPDEGEILYMNTSFQIVNLYKSDVYSMYGDQVPNANTSCFEKSILKALHVINTESNVISFSDMQDLSKRQDLAFHKLEDYEQISILYLLYLQYTKDWNKFFVKKKKYKRIAFAKYRDQFIVLAKNVKAVKMERCPMLIQHFFYESHKKYKFPFKSGDIKQGIETIKQTFVKNQPLRFETITRLFPNTQQLLINGNNFDWSLERLIKFMMKYDLYGVSLQEIQIRFIPQYPTFDEKYQADEQEAAERLQRAKAHKNITKLRRLGWIFETPAHLRRVGFEPLPELPFLLAFIPSDNELFYKTYSRKILNRPLISTNGRIRGITVSATTGTFSECNSYTLDGHNRHSQSGYSIGGGGMRKTSFSAFTANLRKPMAITPCTSVHTPLSPMPALKEGVQSLPGDDIGTDVEVGPYGKAVLHALKMKDSSSSTRSVLSLDDNNYSDEKSPIHSPSPPPPFSQQSQHSFSNLLPAKSFEGENPLVLGYNPKNCVLSQDVVDKLEYKNELIAILGWRLTNYNMKKPNDAIKKKFIVYCHMVQVLVLDPMTPELETLFTVIPNKKPIISFQHIFRLFPSVTDIFLRKTQLNLRIAYRIQDFMKNNPNNKIERIFFGKETRIGKLQIPPLQEILKPANFGFVESEQMVIKNV